MSSLSVVSQDLLASSTLDAGFSSSIVSLVRHSHGSTGLYSTRRTSRRLLSPMLSPQPCRRSWSWSWRRRDLSRTRHPDRSAPHSCSTNEKQKRTSISPSLAL